MKIASDEQIDKKFHVFQKLSVLYVGPNISGKINYYFYSSLRSTSSKLFESHYVLAGGSTVGGFKRV